MYITAQRVATLDCPDGKINTYLYLHGLSDWTECPTPEENPGALERRLITLEPGKNLIVSYLDLVFPDGEPFPSLSSGPLREWVKSYTGMQRFAYDSRIERSGAFREAVLLYSQCKALFESYQATKLMEHGR